MVKEFRTVKRKANVGERILITKDVPKACPYKKGDIFEVTNTFYSNIVSVKGLHNMPVYYADYEVIIETKSEGENEMTTQKLTDYSYEELLDAIKAKAQAEVAFSLGTLAVRTPQEIRDEIIEQAKRDVAELVARGKNDSLIGGTEGNKTYRENFYEPIFVINKDKRTVVTLIKGVGRNGVLFGVRHRGIAKCAPTDCFNSAIGKAISLRRALGLEVPAEYLNVPQPTEVRVGDVIELYRYDKSFCGIFSVTNIESEGWFNLDDGSTTPFREKDGDRIIDDSREGE